MKLRFFYVLFGICAASVMYAEHKPLCYRTVQDSSLYPGQKEYYWHEYKPTTFHGIRAHVYGPTSKATWVIEIIHAPKPTKIIGGLTWSEGERLAESKCPTK